jgi:hypothetical protein
MSNLLERLKACLENGSSDQSLLPEAMAEIGALSKRVNELEELLIMIVRTGWPWDEDNEPNEIFRSSKDGFATAMVEARDLLGLGFRSTITRTEPKT